MAVKRNGFRVLLILLWVFILTPLIITTTIFILISTRAIGYIPDFISLENPQSNLATEIYSSDQVLIGKYYTENRTAIQFDDLSPNIVNALVATEDIRFFKHSGIDAYALARVIIKTLLLGKNTGGGSTITQQLAKNLYNMRAKIFEQEEPKTFIGKTWNKTLMKFQEWVTAVLLERRYTKEEIMVMYLNTVEFGHNAFGIESAALTYYNTTPDALTLDQAAVLVGSLKAPTYYSPKSNPENSLARRNVVLEQIKKYQKKLNRLTGWEILSDEKIDSLKALPIKLDFTIQDHNQGIATYLREYLRLYINSNQPVYDNYQSWNKKQYYIDSALWADDPLYGWCKKNIKPNGENYNLYSDGLKIYTTINSEMQIYAEEAMNEHLGTGKDPLQELFEKDIAKRKNPPFSWLLTDEQVQEILSTSMKRSERYLKMREAGKDSATILAVFNTPTEMEVFSWHGYTDTIMSPWDSILYYKKFLRSGFVSIEPQTGFVRAYVGGIDYNHFKYDHVTVAKRQVGSTFKPFVYTLAMDNGYSPCYKVANIPYSITLPEGQDPPTWTPAFSTCSLDGEMISLKMGLALSLNQIAAWVMKQYSPEAVIQIARDMGVKSDIPVVPSISVGSVDLSLWEMVGAYCTFANKGVFVSPIFVTRIEDKNGNTIATFKPAKNQAIGENTAYRMIELMKGVVQYGTASRLGYKYGFTNEIAGKTGTTDDNSDGWFIGITPNLVSGAWVGGEERTIRFTYTRDGMGANSALPIWALYMQKVYANENLIYSTSDYFEKPKQDDDIISDCDEYEMEAGFEEGDGYHINGEF